MKLEAHLRQEILFFKSCRFVGLNILIYIKFS